MDDLYFEISEFVFTYKIWSMSNKFDVHNDMFTNYPSDHYLLKLFEILKFVFLRGLDIHYCAESSSLFKISAIEKEKEKKVLLICI